MEARVARIGKPHGLRGEVTVRLHTDVPRERFAAGSRLLTRPPAVGPLTVRSARLHNGVWLLAFDEAADRTAAEALRGTELLVAPGRSGAPAGSDAESAAGGAAGGATKGIAAGIAAEADEGWYEDELVGVAVRDVGGEGIGEVTALHIRPAQDLLEVRLRDGRTGLVPFVDALVPVVDLTDPAARFVVIDPPAGLFDLPARG